MAQHLHQNSTPFMIKGTLIFFSFLFLISKVEAQNTKELRLNVLNPGIVWENPIGKKTTMEYNLGIG
jgi:hypothetical protein